MLRMPAPNTIAFDGKPVGLPPYAEKKLAWVVSEVKKLGGSPSKWGGASFDDDDETRDGDSLVEDDKERKSLKKRLAKVERAVRKLVDRAPGDASSFASDAMSLGSAETAKIVDARFEQAMLATRQVAENLQKLRSTVSKNDAAHSRNSLAVQKQIKLALRADGGPMGAVAEVDATRPGCDLYPDLLKPHDELVAVDDELVVSADTRKFQEVLHRLLTAPRPIKLTFIEGEGRDLAFQNQERQRRLAAKSKSPKKPDPPPEAIPDQTLARLTSAMSLDSIARGLSVAFIKEDARDDDDEASRVEARHTALPWCSVSCLGADLQVLETPDATLRYDL